MRIDEGKYLLFTTNTNSNTTKKLNPQYTSCYTMNYMTRIAQSQILLPMTDKGKETCGHKTVSIITQSQHSLLRKHSRSNADCCQSPDQYYPLLLRVSFSQVLKL